MDRFVGRFQADPDGDLAVCAGVAYQRDMSNLVAYDDAYYAKCRSYEDQDIALKINAGRIKLVSDFYGAGALLDVGIGSGEFIKKRPNTYGFDVNPVAIEWLKRNDLWAQYPTDFGAHSYWDVLEHVPDPGIYLNWTQLHGFLFTSIPIFEDLRRIRESKHYRPGEHLYYFTEQGFTDWMQMHGFVKLAVQQFEIDAGRESIYSFAFRRYRWQTS